MADFATRDLQFRLLPWLDQNDCNYVAGQYGARLCDKAKAEEYLAEYEKREKLADEAYEQQRVLLRQGSISHGGEPQELPDQVKIDWNPRKKFQVAAEEIVKETKAEVKAPVAKVVVEEKKRGRPAKK